MRATGSRGKSYWKYRVVETEYECMVVNLFFDEAGTPHYADEEEPSLEGANRQHLTEMLKKMQVAVGLPSISYKDVKGEGDD